MFFLDSLSYLIAALLMFQLLVMATDAPVAPRPQIPSGFIAAFGAGIRILLEVPGCAWFMGMAIVVNCFATPIFLLMPFHAESALGGGVGVYTALIAAFSTGVLAGYLLAGRSALSRQSSARLITGSIVVMCAAFILVAVSSRVDVSVGAMLIAGLANGYWSILFESALQAAVPRQGLGRMYASFGIISKGLVPLAALGGGVVLDLTGKNTTVLFLFCSLVMTGCPVLLLTQRGYRGFFEALAHPRA